MAGTLQRIQYLMLGHQAFDANPAVGELHGDLRRGIACEDGLRDGSSAGVIFQGGDIEQHGGLLSGVPGAVPGDGVMLSAQHANRLDRGHADRIDQGCGVMLTTSHSSPLAGPTLPGE